MTTYELSDWSFARDERRLVAREAWRPLLAGAGPIGVWSALALALPALVGSMRPAKWVILAPLVIGLIGAVWFAWRLRVGRCGFVLDRDAGHLRSPFHEELSLECIVRFELRVKGPGAERDPFFGRLVALAGDDTGLVLCAADDYAEVDRADTLGRQFAEFLGVPFVRRSEPVESYSADRLP